MGTPSRADLRKKRKEREAAKPRPPIFQVNLKELKELIDAAKPALGEERHAALWAICYGMFKALPKRHRSSEKSRNVIPAEAMSTDSKPSSSESEGPVESDRSAPMPSKRPNHKGRRQAADYPSAVHHPGVNGTLRAGALSPCGCGGRLREVEESVVLRFVGRSPIEPHTYGCSNLRCSKCQERFTVGLADEAGESRHQPSAVAVVGVMKYGSGFPFNRMKSMLSLFGIALPATTQFEMVWAGAKVIWPAYAELIRAGAQGSVLKTDDTRMKILEGDRPDEFGERSGQFTTGIQCRIPGGLTAALYITGVKHAGENFADFLRMRAADLQPPIHMSDGLSRNAPKGSTEVISADCMIHGRRYFVDLYDSFPTDCRYVLNSLGTVYANDALAKELELTPEERLALHQRESQPVLEELKKKMEADLAEGRVEDNSGLGKAYRYILKRWSGLTVFLRIAGAPIDNNALERQLKKAVLHRRNSLFYRSDRGAAVGDIYMSLIKTCELNGVNALDYLTQLQVHARELAASPADWLPWTYLQTLKRMALSESSTEALPRAA